MENVLKETKRTLNDRLNNPLLFSFMIAFVICNWKGISYFFFADIDIEEKLIIITKDYYSWVSGFWIPLSIALFYSIALPYINVGIEYILIKSKDFHFDNLNSLEVNDLLRDKNRVKHKVGLEKLEKELREAENDNSIVKNLEEQLKIQDEIISKESDSKRILINNYRILSDNFDLLAQEIQTIKNQHLKNLHGSILESELQKSNELFSQIQQNQMKTKSFIDSINISNNEKDS